METERLQEFTEAYYGEMPEEAVFSEEITEEYVRNLYDDEIPEENLDTVVETMQEYDVKWWELDEPVIVAAYQVFEDTLLTDLDTFRQGIEELVGRPVYNHGPRINTENIREEVEGAIHQLTETGLAMTTEELAEEREVEELKTLLELAEKTGTTIFGFRPEDEE